MAQKSEEKKIVGLLPMELAETNENGNVLFIKKKYNLC